MEWTPDENMPPEEFGPNSKRFTALQRVAGIKKKAGVRQGEEQETFRYRGGSAESQLGDAERTRQDDRANRFTVAAAQGVHFRAWPLKYY